jgi:putative hydrolase of the HAD superfamily
MTIRAILFDLDNTLYPASSGLLQQLDRRIGEYVQERFGLSSVEAAELKRHYYATYGTTLRGLQQHYNHVETDEYLQFVHDIALDAYLQYDAELDASLKHLSVCKVIFTNSPREHAERVLKAMGLAHHFERIFDLRYFNFVAKPNPECYQHILDQLGIKGSEALLMEDTAHNLPPAKALGMTTMLICDAGQTCADADYVIEDLQSALSIAETLVQPEMTALPATGQRVKEPV